MNNINFIWIGGVIPPIFIENYKKCVKLNPSYNVRLFRDKDVEILAREYGVLEIFKNINLVNSINLAKYLTLYYYPGFYSDLDIIWNKPITQLLKLPVNKFYNESSWPNYNKIHKDPEFMSCVRPYIYTYNRVKLYIFDDHLIYATSDGIKKVIDYTREKFNNKEYDVKINFEPFGPISITELVYNKNLKANMWYDMQVQGNGWFCTHTSTRLWG